MFFFIFTFIFLESKKLSAAEGAKGIKDHAVGQASKIVVDHLKKKKRKKSGREKKKSQKGQKRKRSPSPPVDPDLIAQFVERNKRRKKPKDLDAFTDVDRMKELALKQLTPYTSPEFNFNPTLAGDPDELVASRGEREPHVDTLFHHMKVVGSFFKKSTMILVFWDVSLLSLILIFFCSRCRRQKQKGGLQILVIMFLNFSIFLI